MKTDRYILFSRTSRVKLTFDHRSIPFAIGLLALFCVLPDKLFAQSDTARRELKPPQITTANTPKLQSQPQAVALLDQVIGRLANGPAFEAEVRQRVWTAGHNMIGYGNYGQAGNGSGRFYMEITMHDGIGEHTLQQISDGRLAWTRTQIGDNVQLRRVAVGWLEEGVRASGGKVGNRPGQHSQTSQQFRNSPRLVIGGFTEMLDRLRDDYVLRIGTSRLGKRSVYVISGVITETKRAEIMKLSGDSWPELYPTRVNVAVAVANDPESGFGKGLPLRIGFWSDPAGRGAEQLDEADGQSDRPSTTTHGGRIISLVEIFSPKQIQPPAAERFRFENTDQSIDIIDETSRYENRFGIRVSAKERARRRW